MKKIHFLLVFNFLCIAGLAFYVFFQTETPKTAFIYNQKVFEEFKATKELQQKLQAYSLPEKKYLDSLALLIQAGRSDLQFVYDQKQEAYASSYEQLSERYTADVWKHINEAISAYGELHHYDYVFGASGNGSLMFANKSEDITEEMIEYLNLKYEGD